MFIWRILTFVSRFRKVLSELLQGAQVTLEKFILEPTSTFKNIKQIGNLLESQARYHAYRIDTLESHAKFCKVKFCSDDLLFGLHVGTVDQVQPSCQLLFLVVLQKLNQ